MRFQTRFRWLVLSTSLAAAAAIICALQGVRWIAGTTFSPSIGPLAVVALVLAWTSARLAGVHQRHAASESAKDFIVRETRLGLGLSAGALAVVAVASDITDLSRLGPTQYAILAASVLAAVGAASAGWLHRRSWIDRSIAGLARVNAESPVDSELIVPSMRAPTSPRERALAAALIVSTGAAFLWLVSDGPLGHDESVYAVKARSWMEGTPASGFGLHRPIGMAVLARAVFQFGQSEVSLRVVGAAAALASIVLVWRLGRTMLSPAAGIVAAVLVAASPSFLRRAPEFLNDIASSAIVLAIILLLWRHFEDDRGSRWLVLLTAPLAAAGFYLRYGTASTLVVVAVVGGILWRRKLAESWKPLAATAGLLGLFLLPHLIYAQAKTGSVTGILSRSTEAAGREYLGEGLVTYLKWLPDRLAGPLLGGVVVLGGIVAVAAAILLPRGQASENQTRAKLLLAGVAIAHVVLSGLFVHAEERYVFISIMLLGLVGSQAVTDAYRWLAKPLRRSAIAVAVAAVLSIFTLNLFRAEAKFEDLSEDRQVIEDVGSLIQAESGQDECTVMTSYVPQITWYSLCGTVAFNLERPPETVLSGNGSVDFLLLFENGKRQPEGPVLEAYLEAIGDTEPAYVDDLETVVGDATVYAVTSTTPGQP